MVTAAPQVSSAPFVLTTSPPLASADVHVQAPRVPPDEPVPPRYAGNRSLVRIVIDSTGPIGRRPVILAGVLIAVLIGIGAFRLEERTHVLRRIQEWRHFENT